MKRLFWTLVLTIVAAVSGLFTSVYAQDTPSNILLYQFAAVTQNTTTGQLGNYLVVATNQLGAAPNNYSIDWTVTGTTPSVCTFRVEGSSDNMNWVGLDATSPSAISCTASGGESIAYKPWPYLRIYLASWTAGSSTSKAVFHFTGTRN